MGVTAEDLQQLVQQPVPRAASTNIRQAALRTPSVYFFYIFGLIWLLVGVPLCGLFFPRHVLSSLGLEYADQLVVTETKEHHSEKTWWKEGKGSRAPRIHKVTFRFTAPETGGTYEGWSYTTKPPAPGHPIVIEYLPDNPACCRVRGMRLNTHGLSMLFMLIFPGIGVVSLILFAFKWRACLRTLESGELISGEIGEIEKTASKQNKKNLYAIHLRYEYGGTSHQTRYTISEQLVGMASEKKTRGEPVGLLVDPTNPTCIIVLDALLQD